MTLLIDNYDSFSYNLYQMVGAIDPDITVLRNDEKTVEEIRELHPDRIILSPGPGRPADAGICEELVKKLRTSGIPILGVCLGEQAICEAYGGVVGYAKELMHGKQSLTEIDQTSQIFKGLPGKIPVARYHSLAAEEASLPNTLKVIARTDDGEVMAVQDTEYPVYGLQFHPESIMTPDGAAILENYCAMKGESDD